MAEVVTYSLSRTRFNNKNSKAIIIPICSLLDSMKGTAYDIE